MTQLTIANKTIRTRNGRYSLNDLHRAAGGDKRHETNKFVRRQSTQALIAEIERTPESGYALEAHQAGKHAGTWACKELVYAYAMWISPKFHLHVIRAFDALQQEEHPAGAPQLKNRRWLVTYDEAGTEHVTPVPDDALVMPLPAMLKAINEANGIQLDAQTLADTASACIQRLAQRCERLEAKAAGKRVPLKWLGKA